MRPSEDYFEATDEPWHDLYWRAWDALRYDRPYGAMGGEMPISYVALSRYGRDNEIAGEDFGLFLRFMGAVDGEWLKRQAERLKTEIKA